MSTHSIPFGSSSLYTKHENAARNSGPQGPWAIPPRQGQSQFISPVRGLNAPPEDSEVSEVSSCSLEFGEVGVEEGSCSSEEIGKGSDGSGVEVGGSKEGSFDESFEDEAVDERTGDPGSCPTLSSTPPHPKNPKE